MADCAEADASGVLAASGPTLEGWRLEQEGSAAAVSSVQGLRHKLKCHTMCQWSLN